MDAGIRRAITFGIATLAIAGTSWTALAADLGARPITKAPIIAPPVFSWTGCYIGGNVGWSRAEHDLTTFAAPFPTNNINDAARTAIINSGIASLDQDGFTGGGQVGCNYQAGSFVFGIEGDFNALDVGASRDTGEFIEPISGRRVRSIDSISQDWFATVRGRVGYAWDRFLVYGTGGVAITELNINKSFSWDFPGDLCPILGTLNNCHVGGFSDTRTGWTAGGGFEWAFAPSWSVKAEYLFADFGSVSYVTANRGLAFNPPLQTATHTVDSTLQVVRLGVNWRFGSMFGP